MLTNLYHSRIIILYAVSKKLFQWLKCVAMVLLLQFSNMVPDFVITGPQYRARGPAGYLCAGFWDSRWDFRPELVSCPHCL